MTDRGRGGVRLSETVKGFRFVMEDLRSERGDVQWIVGEWQKCEGVLGLCENGFHASEDALDSLSYVFGTRWFRCEARGAILHGGDKFCAREMRLTGEIPLSVLRRFAVECAGHVLSIFEKKYPDDLRPRRAVEAAESYLDDPTDANEEEVEAAVWAAAGAAGAAAGAAWAAGAARAAAGAAWAAEAAGAAADATERDWQRKMLLRLLDDAEKEEEAEST